MIPSTSPFSTAQSVASPRPRRRRRTIVKRVSDAVYRRFLLHCINRVATELAAMRGQLAGAEEEQRIRGPYTPDGVALLAVALRQQVESLEEELAMMDQKLSALNETECAELHVAMHERIAA